jgi:hypothetical protein
MTPDERLVVSCRTRLEVARRLIADVMISGALTELVDGEATLAIVIARIDDVDAAIAGRVKVRSQPRTQEPPPCASRLPS